MQAIVQKSMPLYQFSSPVSPLDFSIYRRICNGQRTSARQRAKLDEIKRIVQALPVAGGRNCAFPGWRPGGDAIVSTAGSCGTAKGRMESSDANQD